MKLDIGAYFILLGIILALSSNNILYAHNFYQNDNSVFYTLIKQFEIEKNLASKNQLSNLSSFSIHKGMADEFFYELASLGKNVTEKSSFSNQYDDTFSDLNLTTKALVSANLADEVLREYGLSIGLDPKVASGLINMSVGMIMKMKDTSSMNMSDSTNIDDMEKMSPMVDDQSSAESTKGSNVIKNLANYETSIELAKSLKTLFTNYLQGAKLEESAGLMPIPTEMKINAKGEMGQGIDKLIIALNRNAPVQEVYSIVHGQIHPNLFLAFSLKLKSD